MAKITFDTNNKEFMNTKIDDLKLSGRTHNGIRRAGFETVGEVINNLDNLNQITSSGWGETSRAEFERVLLRHYADCLDVEHLIVFLAELNSQGVEIKAPNFEESMNEEEIA